MRQTRNMDTERSTAGQSRRLLLSGGATMPAVLAACAFPVRAQEAGDASAERAQGSPEGAPPAEEAPAEVLAATPECVDDDDVTPAQTEGPYFTPNSPQRTSLLENGMRGTRLTVAGRVLTTACQPVARALVDFWQCDDVGAYDNRGYGL